MNNENNKDTSLIKIVKYWSFFYILFIALNFTFYHIYPSDNPRGLLNEFLAATIMGIVLSSVISFNAYKRGIINDGVINFKKHGYWAFTQISLMYMLVLLGIIHIFDYEGTYMVSEIICSVFFGLFCGSLQLLYRIKKNKKC